MRDGVADDDNMVDNLCGGGDDGDNVDNGGVAEHGNANDDGDGDGQR